MSKCENIEALARAVHTLEKAASSAAGGHRGDVADKCCETVLAVLGGIDDLIGEGVGCDCVKLTESQIDNLTRRVRGEDAEGSR